MFRSHLKLDTCWSTIKLGFRQLCFNVCFFILLHTIWFGRMIFGTISICTTNAVMKVTVCRFVCRFQSKNISFWRVSCEHVISVLFYSTSWLFWNIIPHSFVKCKLMQHYLSHRTFPVAKKTNIGLKVGICNGNPPLLALINVFFILQVGPIYRNVLCSKFLWWEVWKILQRWWFIALLLW